MPAIKPALLTATAIAAALTGCALGTGARAEYPHSSNAVLKAVWVGGSPAPVGRTPLPAFELLGDGTLLTPGPASGSLPAIRAFHLTREATDRLYRRALDAGLATPHRYDEQVSDAGALIVTLATTTRAAITHVTLPSRSDHGRRGAIARLGSLDPAALSAKDQTRPPDAYRPGQLALIVSGDTGTPVRAWPFTPPGQGGATANHGRCVIVGGDELRRVQDLAATASPGTLWTSHGMRYRLSFRPLLPGETDCAALGIPR